MPSSEAITLFIGAALLLLIIPGPAVTYIVTRSLSQGTKAGLISIGGLATGTVIHVAAAAIGLSAVLTTFPIAFYLLKFAGAGYLIWLGIQKLREGDGEAIQPTSLSTRRVFTDGLVVNLLNPKSALFFFAFLPQFADPARGSVALQIVVFGAIFLVLSFFTDSAYALLAGRVSQFLRGGSLRAGRLLAGSVYLSLGFVAAFTGNRE